MCIRIDLTIRHRIRNVIFCLLIFSLSISNLVGQDFRLTSFIDYYGTFEPTERYDTIRTRLFFRPLLMWRADDFLGGMNARFNLSANVWLQPEGNPYAVPKQYILDEAFFQFGLGDFDLSVGQKVISWGFADVMGPLNIIQSANPIIPSLADGFDSRIAQPLLHLQYHRTVADSISLVYVPFTRPDLQGPDSVFLPGSMDSVYWNTDWFITDRPNSLFVNYSYWGEQFDLQLLYGWYVDPKPDFTVKTADPLTADVIRAVHNRKQTVGFAWSRRLGRSTFSQDIAFDFASNHSGRVIGAQKSRLMVNNQILLNLPFNILSQYSLVYAWFPNHGAYKSGENAATTKYLDEQFNAFHTQPLPHIAFIVAHVERTFLRDKLRTTLNVGFFFSPELYIAPRLSYSLTDLWQFQAGADINLGAPSKNDLRRNPFNDNFYVRIVYRR